MDREALEERLRALRGGGGFTLRDDHGFPSFEEPRPPTFGGDMAHHSRLDAALHESAHSIARQLLIGDLAEMGIKRRGAYSYPAERRPFDEMAPEHLAKIAVVVEAGIVAERTLCGATGNASIKEYAISDDVRQREGIRRIAGFSDEQMEGFARQAAELVEAHETAIRKTATELNRRNKLTGEQVSRLMEKYPPDPEV